MNEYLDASVLRFLREVGSYTAEPEAPKTDLGPKEMQRILSRLERRGVVSKEGERWRVVA